MAGVADYDAAKYHSGMIVGRIRPEGGEWRLSIYSLEKRRKRARLLAVVIGSEGYVQSALAALGPGLAKDWDGRQSALVSSEPPYRHAKRAR